MDTTCAACSLPPVIRHLPKAKRMPCLPTNSLRGSSWWSLPADITSLRSTRRTYTGICYNHPGTSVLGPCPRRDIFSSTVQQAKYPAIVLPLNHLSPRGGRAVLPLALTPALPLSLCGNLSLPQAQQDEYQTCHNNRQHTGSKDTTAYHTGKNPSSTPAAQTQTTCISVNKTCVSSSRGYSFGVSIETDAGLKSKPVVECICRSSLPAVEEVKCAFRSNHTQESESGLQKTHSWCYRLWVVWEYVLTSCRSAGSPVSRLSIALCLLESSVCALHNSKLLFAWLLTMGCEKNLKLF